MKESSGKIIRKPKILRVIESAGEILAPEIKQFHSGWYNICVKKETKDLLPKMKEKFFELYPNLMGSKLTDNMLTYQAFMHYLKQEAKK